MTVGGRARAPVPCSRPLFATLSKKTRSKLTCPSCEDLTPVSSTKSNISKYFLTIVYNLDHSGDGNYRPQGGSTCAVRSPAPSCFRPWSFPLRPSPALPLAIPPPQPAVSAPESLHPRLLDSLALNASPSVTPNIPEGTQITVSFVVDGNGQPRDIHVVQGYNMVWNALAIDAVSRLHYRPAMLDNQPIAMNMNLVITLAR